MKSSIRQPLGVVPRSNTCSLPQEYAQCAENIDLTQVGWVPWKQPVRMVEFEHKVLSAHIRDCCWAGVPVPRACYFTANACGSKTYLSAADEYPVYTDDFCSSQWTRLGFPVPAAPDVCVLDNSQNCDLMTDKRTYKLVFGNDCEQGAGSVPSEVVHVNDKSDVVVSIPSDVDPCWGVTHVKVYREISTWDIEKGFLAFDGDFNPGFADVGTESDYFYVGQVPLGTTEFVDDIKECIGHSLLTDDFYPPKKGLKIIGETNLQSLVGHEGKNLWISERNAYWAYPLRARHNFPDEIMCAAVCQDLIIVITRTNSYIVEDTVDCRDSTCRNVTEGKEAFHYCGTGSCLVVAQGIVYTTTQGLFHTRVDGTTVNLSGAAFSEQDWRLAQPDQMHLGQGDNHLFVTSSATTFAFPLRFSEQGILPEYISHLLICPDAWINDEHGYLYFLQDNQTFQFNAGQCYMEMLWRQFDQRPGIRTRASVLKADYEQKKIEEGNAISIYRDGVARTHTRKANKASRFKSVLSDCYAIEVRGDIPMCGLHYGVGLSDLTLSQ